MHDKAIGLKACFFFHLCSQKYKFFTSVRHKCWCCPTVEPLRQVFISSCRSDFMRANHTPTYSWKTLFSNLYCYFGIYYYYLFIFVDKQNINVISSSCLWVACWKSEKLFKLILPIDY